MEEARGSRCKLHCERFHLDKRKTFFTVKRIIHRNNFPREVVEFALLEVGRVLGNLMYIPFSMKVWSRRYLRSNMGHSMILWLMNGYCKSIFIIIVSVIQPSVCAVSLLSPYFQQWRGHCLTVVEDHWVHTQNFSSVSSNSTQLIPWNSLLRTANKNLWYIFANINIKPKLLVFQEYSCSIPDTRN